MSCRILVIEDDQDINRLLTAMLTENSYVVASAYSGSEAKLVLSNDQFDCILLDLMLPGIEGEALIQQVRERSTVPIIIVSAKLGTDARVTALRLGADDFISKPFENEEVLARVEAQIRRSKEFSTQKQAETHDGVFRYKNCLLDTKTMTVSINDEIVDFTALEYQVLSLFLQNPKRVFTRENIFTLCWKQEYLGEENTIDVHISHIRNKIAQHEKGDYIKTVRGIGYRLSN